MEANALVFVVEDDASMRESLKNLLRSVALRVEAFASAQEFLRSTRPDVPGYRVLEVRLPGLSGLELQQRLAEVDLAMPSIFITGHGDIPMTVQAMKAGAVTFLPKPSTTRICSTPFSRRSHAAAQRASSGPRFRNCASALPR
jgi:FixJ family two-component response regulator